jgi:tungstate transport system substrate-binding protein
VQCDPHMLNPYSIIAVNPFKYTDVKNAAAMKLILWLTSDAGKKKIAEFRANDEQVFFPY